jgi:GTP-binding protein
VYRLPPCYLIDLPGYGFARASKSDRVGYAKLLQGVLAKRPQLKGVVWLLDTRRDPSTEDRRFGAQLAERQTPALIALTKADKLGRAAQRERVLALAQALELPESQFELTSSSTGLGIAELGESILAAVEAR